MNATNKDNAMKYCLMIFLCVAGLIDATTMYAYDTTAKSLLWRITAANGATSFVMGTIHVGDSAVFRQRDSVVLALKASRRMYAEIDLDSAAGQMLADPSIMFLGGGKTLHDLYTPAEYDLIMTALRKKMGPMASAADRMKPSMIVALLAQDELSNEPGMIGMDQFLWQTATSSGVERRGVESAREQLTILDSMPPSVLLDFLKNDHEQDSMFQQLITLYATEDLAAVGLLMKELDDWGTFGMSINDNRNARMVERLRPEFAKGGIMLAVGALHLPGPNGVLSRLERAGYRVTPVVGGKRVNLLASP
jgi:uncharacterized protein YbaP (TraB family)